MRHRGVWNCARLLRPARDTERELRELSRISRARSTAADLGRALGRHYGLEGKGYRAEIDQLHHIALPAIAALRFHHYVEIEEVHDDRIVINDPDGEPRGVPLEYLREDYTGIVLTFRPSPAFSRSGSAFRPFRALARALKPFSAPLAIAALASWIEWAGPVCLARGVIVLVAGDRAGALGWMVHTGEDFFS